MKVIGYVRVSTEKQDIGPVVQEQALRHEAERHGWELDLRFELGVSAKSLHNRPVLLAALDDVKAKRADAIAVYRLDRLSRSVHDFSGLLQDSERQGWGLIALDLALDTTSPTGALMAHVVSSFSQFERSRIAERTKQAMANLPPERKEKVGRPASVSESTVARIVELHREGKGPSAIARVLATENIVTPSGTPFTPQRVSGVLKSRPALALLAESA